MTASNLMVVEAARALRRISANSNDLEVTVFEAGLSSDQATVYLPEGIEISPVVVKARELISILREGRGNDPFRFNEQTVNGEPIATGGRATTPQQPEATGASVEIPASLAKAVAVAAARASEDYRPMLRSVLLNDFALAATDSYRIHADQSVRGPQLAIPAYVAKALGDFRVFGSAERYTLLGANKSGGRIVYNNSKQEITTISPEKMITDFRPKRPIEIHFSAAAAAAVGAVKKERFTIEISGKKVKDEQGQQLGISSGGDMKIAFNPKFLAEALRFVGDQAVVEIEEDNPLKPALLSRNKRLALVMPIRLED